MAVTFSSHNVHVQAKEAEQAGEIDQAIKLYQQAIKNQPLDDLAYNRLMVNYRKRKDYKKEEETINAAIASHLRSAKESQMTWLNSNKKTARTAKSLAKSLGFLDKKGTPKLETRQLATWRKRLTVVKKRLQQAGQRKRKS